MRPDTYGLGSAEPSAWSRYERYVIIHSQCPSRHISADTPSTFKEVVGSCIYLPCMAKAKAVAAGTATGKQWANGQLIVLKSSGLQNYIVT